MDIEAEWKSGGGKPTPKRLVVRLLSYLYHFCKDILLYKYNT